MENSLDAGATHIRVTLRGGGVKSLLIQDNGHGIRKSDLPLLCERFATSKLRNFNDLFDMHTFGFRGEALASISFISASVQVVSKRRDEECAYRAEYFAGSLVSGPQPCAGTNGTSIMIQDMFFNAPQRKHALRSASEEYNRALDIVTKYALHYGPQGVSFSCKKADQSRLDLQLTSTPNTSIVDTIRSLYGVAIARDLIPMKDLQNEKLGFRAEGQFSTANWMSKKTTFICFINHRLVDCTPLKRALESVYTLVLPKGQHPWIYVALDIEPNRIDVNVHPTKQEVHFLDEDDVFEAISAQVQDALVNQSSCRVFRTQSAQLGEVISEDHVQVTRARSYDPRHLVRVDQTEQTLDSMPLQKAGLPDRIRPSECTLESITQLRDQVLASKNAQLSHIVQHHTFVGIVDLAKGLCLIQHSTQLYLVQYGILIEEFAYQLALQQFGSFSTVRLEPPPSLRELIGIGYDMELADIHTAPLELSKAQVVERIAKKLLAHTDMLRKHVGIHIDAQEETVLAIPTLLPQHGSSGVCLERLPSLLFRLGPQVDWEDEKGCFYTLCHELALAHVPPSWGTTRDDLCKEQQEQEAWSIQHVWFAHMLGSRGRCFVPNHLPDDIMTQIASLPDLYRVFERC